MVSRSSVPKIETSALAAMMETVTVGISSSVSTMLIS
jgi:hypothetical protein